MREYSTEGPQFWIDQHGGAHHPDNMQCLCDSCNARKVVLIDSKATQ